jgi:hypothetical protein
VKAVASRFVRAVGGAVANVRREATKDIDSHETSRLRGGLRTARRSHEQTQGIRVSHAVHESLPPFCER